MDEIELGIAPPVLAGGLVVGIGASAGSLEALRRFLGEVPRDAGLALILAAPSAEGAGSDLLDRLPLFSPLPVVGIEEGGRLEPNRLHVAPPNAIVSLKGDRFRLRPPRTAGEKRNPVDRFLSALAASHSARAVGVLLSGAGSDGALGLGAIGVAGGMTMAQAPDTAAFAEAPGATSADHVLAPDDLARALAAYASHWRDVASGPAPQDRRRELAARLPEICDVLHRRTGHDFRHYKTTTLIRRLERRMQVRALGLDAYVGELARDGQEPHTLFRELLIGVTSFFREPDAFAALSERVIVPLLRERSDGEAVRIWIPGCATGEEAYSVAMLAREGLDRVPNPPRVQIFATDVNERALLAARRGSFPQGISAQVSPERLSRFFVKRGRRFQVADEIREMCLFSAHNLIGDPPFSRLDLISCRNLLIYLGSHLQKKLIPVFHYALRPGGSLFLGASESIAGHGELFRVVDAKHRIARRKDVPIRVPGQVAASDGAGPAAPRGGQPKTEADLGAVAQRILLDEFAPKYAIVEEDGKVVFLSEGADLYIQPPAGSFSNTVLRMARRGLSVGLRTAFGQAVRTRRTVVREVPAVQTAEGPRSVRLTVQPMPDLGRAEGLVMLVFQDLGPPLRRSDADGPVDRGADAVIDGLERELQRTREDLERTVQDLEAANEELKSSNEELLSMNEELQSANEELETAKDEIQAANGALASANADLENLLRSTRIATIFLDRGGAIRGFTPAASEIYNLAAGDVGRPLSHFTHRLRAPPPLPSLDDVADRGEPLDDEAEGEDGRFFLRRVLPYRAPDGTADGLVVTFVDLTHQKRAEAELARANGLLRVVGETTPDLIFVKDRDSRMLYANPATLGVIGRTAAEVLGRSELDWHHDPNQARMLVENDRRVMAAGRTEIVEEIFTTPGGTRRVFSSTKSPMRGPDGSVDGIVAVATDITERKRVEDALARGVAVMEAAHEAAKLGIWSYDFAGRTLNGDARARALFGFSEDEPLTRRDWARAVHPDDLAAVEAEFLRAGRDGNDVRAEFRVVHRRSGPASVLAFGRRLPPGADGKGPLITGVFLDVTERRRAEEALRESKDRFEAAVQALEGILWTSNGRGEMEGEQAGWAALTGQAYEAYQGYGWSDAIHPDDAGPAIAGWNQAVAEGRTFASEHRVRTRGGEWRHFAARAVPVRGVGGRVREWVGVHADVTARRKGEERQALLIRELHHRVKNTLATVQAIVGSTARSVDTIEEFYQGFVGRIVSLANTHNLLTEDDWQTASLRQLLEDELGPYDDGSGGRVTLGGPTVELPSESAVPIGMAIHELTTNAAKHGALSVRGGRVRVRWSVVVRDGRSVLAFDWAEEGGPPVEQPTRQGFGSRLLRRVLTAQLQAEVTVAFDPDGLRFGMEAPLPRGPAAHALRDP